MVKKWKDIRAKKLSAEARTENDRWVEQELLEMDLRAVRELVGMTQAATADAAGISQGELSRMERRDDHRLSTLRRYVEALGGEIEVRAVFAEKTVKLHV